MSYIGSSALSAARLRRRGSDQQPQLRAGLGLDSVGNWAMYREGDDGDTSRVARDTGAFAMLPRGRRTSCLAIEAFEAMIEAVKCLKPYGLQISEATRDNSYAEVTAKSEVTFVRITWDPRDKYMYDIGPTVDGKVPPYEIWYDASTGASSYGLYSFIELASPLDAQQLNKMRGMSESPGAGVAAVVEFAGHALAGDWSCRPDLERIINDHFRERNE